MDYKESIEHQTSAQNFSQKFIMLLNRYPLSKLKLNNFDSQNGMSDEKLSSTLQQKKSLILFPQFP